MRKAVAIVVLGCALAAVTAARGDIPPPPGQQEANFLSLIEGANHPCGKVASFRNASGSDADALAKEGLDAFDVTCSNGKVYLVAVPQRRPGPPRLGPDGKPIPYPDPVVKEITR